MQNRDIEVLIRGKGGPGTFDAAYAISQALHIVGASVELRTPVTQHELSSDALRGVRVLVRVEESSACSPARQELAKSSDFAQVAKIGIGVVLLLMLFGAELRLRFGFRLDMIMTLVGVWMFWRYCLKSRADTALVRRGSSA